MPNDIMFTREEIRRADVLRDLRARLITKKEAAGMLQISLRHLRRVFAKFILLGIDAVRSRKRGKPSNNRIPEAYLNTIIECYKQNLNGCGPTQAVFVLATEYGLSISREKLRTTLIAHGLWFVGKKPSERSRPPRERERSTGSLLQVDASVHRWVDNGETQCLLVFIDDATSKLMRLEFVPNESADAYLANFKAYIEKYGRPVSVYADRHAALFRRGKKATGTGGLDFTSDLARALQDLNVIVVTSYSAQGRGRVERVHRTLQDWLPKYLKRKNAVTMEAANAWLPAFICEHNQRFAMAPANPEDRHRDLLPGTNLDLMMSRQFVRTITRHGLVQFHGNTYLLTSWSDGIRPKGRKLTVHAHPDGRISLSSDGVIFPCRLVGKASGLST